MNMNRPDAVLFWQEKHIATREMMPASREMHMAEAAAMLS
jgi:hypothetical protein